MAKMVNRKRKSAQAMRVNKYRTRTVKGKYIPKARMNIAKVVNKVMARKLETKQSNLSNSSYQQISHNNFITLDNTVLKTTQGTSDLMTGTDTANRIGDEITLKGVSMKFMLELNERYSDVTFRIILVRAARGDTPTLANLFTNLTGNKMLDTFNTERYTIIAQKYVKMKSPNMTMGLGGSATATGSGVYYAGDNPQANYLSRSTRIVRMYVPGAKFARNGLIKYDGNGTSQKFFDYHVLCYAYSNFSTSDALGFYVGAVSTYVKQMFYTDA